MGETCTVDPTATDADDDALMAAWTRGDARAFDRLYARHHAALYRVVGRALGRAHAARADEVFRQSWLHLAMARERGWSREVSCRAGLLAAAVRRMAEARRDVRDRSPVPAGVGDAAAPDDEQWLPTVPGDLDLPASTGHEHDPGYWHGAGRRLLQRLEALEPVPRALVVLYHGEGVPLADSARALDLEPDAARRHLLDAQFSLQQGMGAYLWTDLPQIGAPTLPARAIDDAVPRDQRLVAAFRHAPDHDAEPDVPLSTRILVDARCVIRTRSGGVDGDEPPARLPPATRRWLRLPQIWPAAVTVPAALALAVFATARWVPELERYMR